MGRKLMKKLAYQKKSKSKYKHIWLTEEKRFLLGVPQILIDDEFCVSELPMQVINNNLLRKRCDLMKSIVSLNARDRDIIFESIEKWNKMQGKKAFFERQYLDIVLDFIFEIYGDTMFDIAEKISEKDEDVKLYYDRLDKAIKSKGQCREETKGTIQTVCDLYRITREIIMTGKGFLIIPNTESSNYTVENIQKYRKEEGNENKPLEEMVMDIIGLEGNEIAKIPLEIVVNNIEPEDKIGDFLEILIEEM